MATNFEFNNGDEKKEGENLSDMLKNMSEEDRNAYLARIDADKKKPASPKLESDTDLSVSGIRAKIKELEAAYNTENRKDLKAEYEDQIVKLEKQLKKKEYKVKWDELKAKIKEEENLYKTENRKDLKAVHEANIAKLEKQIKDLENSNQENAKPVEAPEKAKDTPETTEQKAAATAAKVEAVKNDIVEKLKLDTTNKTPLWEKNLGSSGLTVADLEKVPEFVKLSTGEQLLVLDEINQRNARKMDELTKDRVAESFAKKNVVMKFFHGLSKNFQKATAEKTVAGQIRNGEHKVDTTTIRQISERIKELGLSVNEQNGEVLFLKSTQEGIGKYLTPAQIKEYNEVANKYTKLPTDWQHEKTANKNFWNPFKNNEYKEFQKIDSRYNALRAAIMGHLENNYMANGGGAKEARLGAQELMMKTELGFDYLNYSRKYPEAATLLENSSTQNAYKKLLTGDIKTFLGGAGIGMAFKAAGGILGGTAFGGIRGFFLGKKDIKDQYKSDQIDLTRQEAKEIGINKKDTIDRFINADDQVRKINVLVSKIEKAETEEEKLVLAQRLKTRIDYINDKKYNGLINRGKNDDIALNFEFNKALAAGTAAILVYTGGKALEQGIEAQYNKDRLAQFSRYINASQNGKYEDERRRRVINSALRGAAIGTAGAVFGHYLNGWLHGGDQVAPVTGGTPIDGQPWPPISAPEVDHSLDVTIDKGQGMIHFAGQLKQAVAEKWGGDITNAPESIRHIMNTNSADLAKEFGGFKPGQVNESAMLHQGSTFHMDNQGNLFFKDPATGESDVFQWGSDINKGADYHGKMFDYQPRGMNVDGAAPNADMTQSGAFENPTIVDANGQPVNGNMETVPGTRGPIQMDADQINKNPTSPNSPTTDQSFSTNSAEATRSATESSVSGGPLHPSHPQVEQVFPKEVNVQGFPRQQFDEVAKAMIRKELQLPEGAKLLDTPQTMHRIWLYENFGEVRQTGSDTFAITEPRGMDYAKLSETYKPSTDKLGLLIKDLENRVYGATGQKIDSTGITANEYTKRLIAELYK